MVNILEQFSGSHIVLIDSWCLRDATLPGKAESVPLRLFAVCQRLLTRRVQPNGCRVTMRPRLRRFARIRSGAEETRLTAASIAAWCPIL